MENNNLQETLDRILHDLKSEDVSVCLQALRELATVPASSKAINAQLEHVALSDDLQVREAALTALSLRTSQVVASKRTTHVKFNRNLLLTEIDAWQADGLIEPYRAEILRRRYDFDSKPATTFAPAPAQAIAELIQQPAPKIPQPTSEVPRPSLMQTLLSESSIKIYLYLGAFFVIASALILAALVAAARLPILAAATLAFGGGALIIHKRLPQPSFALFIVFSFLLPIDANVLEETIGLHEPALSIYWTFVFLAMAVIWGFSVWYYTSSFFSAVAFVALSLAFYRLTQIFQTEDEPSILFGVFASLAGLLSVYVLKKWKSNRFALPVFLLAQAQVIGLLLISVALVTVDAFNSHIAGGWWLVITFTWIAAGTFFAASDILFPFVLFPWMAVAALLPLPWFFLNTFDLKQPAYAIGFWIWAAVFALVSEAAFRFEKIKKYGWAFLAGSAPLFLTAIFIAFDWDDPALTLTLVAGAALVYAALHILRRRWYVWGAALLSGLVAYYLMFTLPTIQKLDIPVIYQILGACVLLLVPELFAPRELTAKNQTRLPMLALGLFLSFICIANALTFADEPGHVAIVFLTFAILFTLHAFHFNKPWIGYAAAASEILTVIYALRYFDKDWWLPALALMSLLYYASGFFLRRTISEMKSWGLVLINSGLILGVVLSLSGLLFQKETSGWYMILIAALFAVETFARPFALLELVVEILLTFALFRIFTDFYSPNADQHFLFTTSLVWLIGDLVFSRLVRKRIHRPATLGIGFLFVVMATIYLFTWLHSYIPVAYCLVYAVFFGIYAFLQREPRFGYLVTTFLALSAVKLSIEVEFNKWIFPLIALAVFYYALGFLLRRNQRAKGWEIMLLNSGLALGVITSLIAPSEGGLDSSIPIAIAATLFAVEAFALRSVWWALPADGLYLMSYFVLLHELNVDEPQFYSIGAALLGMLMHYLLVKAGSKTGAFMAGMLSQLVLLGTTYIQMVSTNQLRFFFVLFVQSMIVLVYGLVQRSRSLVITPIAFAVLGVVTVVYSALKEISSVILVGCTGIVLLLLGIGAVLLRERITRIGEQLSDWRP